MVHLLPWSVYRLSYPGHDLSAVCCIPPANEATSLGVSSRETGDATRGCLYFTGRPFCYLLCTRRQVNCQINPTGQRDYLCFASATHQFPYFYCFILSLYFLIRFSLSFIQSCLCLVYFFCTQRDSEPSLSFLCSLHFISFSSLLPSSSLFLHCFPSFSLSFQSHLSRKISFLFFPFAPSLIYLLPSYFLLRPSQFSPCFSNTSIWS